MGPISAGHAIGAAMARSPAATSLDTGGWYVAVVGSFGLRWRRRIADLSH
jgi:hypothetical protein